jgi:DNA-directed RNA polymerase specialized sigma24 family protein
VLSDGLAIVRTRRRASDRRGTRAPRALRPAVSAAGRERIAAALARRGARERLMLTLLLYERLFPIEVAHALGVSVRQVERTVGALLAELRRALPRPAGRPRMRAGSTRSRLRKAA